LGICRKVLICVKTSVFFFLRWAAAFFSRLRCRYRSCAPPRDRFSTPSITLSMVSSMFVNDDLNGAGAQITGGFVQRAFVRNNCSTAPHDTALHVIPRLHFIVRSRHQTAIASQASYSMCALCRKCFHASHQRAFRYRYLLIPRAMASSEESFPGATDRKWQQ